MDFEGKHKTIVQLLKKHGFHASIYIIAISVSIYEYGLYATLVGIGVLSIIIIFFILLIKMFNR
jgi:hypothetical protein